MSTFQRQNLVSNERGVDERERESEREREHNFNA